MTTYTGRQKQRAAPLWKPYTCICIVIVTPQIRSVLNGLIFMLSSGHVGISTLGLCMEFISIIAIQRRNIHHFMAGSFLRHLLCLWISVLSGSAPYFPFQDYRVSEKQNVTSTTKHNVKPNIAIQNDEWRQDHIV